MRFVVALVACVGIALTVAGCDPTDRHYVTQGVGINIYPEDVAAQTDLQNAYIEDVCRQAGLEPMHLDGVSTCGPDPNNPNTWLQFVLAGMNDIDRRCDAYLTWLDNVRRTREPVLQQLSDTRTATELIMRTAGVGANPITIVGAAFGLASSSFNNLNSRLILDVPHSTVQALVLGRQKTYRDDLLGNGDTTAMIAIPGRPGAIFALRSYLRLCMPMTVETEINNTITTVERAGPDALKNDPMISAASVGPVLVISQPANDASRSALRAQLFPNGSKTPDPVIVAYVQEILGPPRIAIGVILNQPGLLGLRQKISACIVARAGGQACKSSSLAKFR